MTTISQKYVNLLKTCLKEKICCLSDGLIDYLINNLFNNGKNNVYIEFINKIQKFSIGIIKETIVEVFKELDNNFRNSIERIKYYNTNKSKKFFCDDEIFHLPKYDHHAPIINMIFHYT